jgi:hypothetical protein
MGTLKTEILQNRRFINATDQSPDSFEADLALAK